MLVHTLSHRIFVISSVRCLPLSTFNGWGCEWSQSFTDDWPVIGFISVSYRWKVTVGLPLTALFCSVSFLESSVMLNWTLIRAVMGLLVEFAEALPKVWISVPGRVLLGVIHYPPKNLNVKLLVWLICFCLLEEWWHDQVFLLGLVHVYFLIVKACSGMLCELPHLRDAWWGSWLSFLALLSTWGAQGTQTEHGEATFFPISPAGSRRSPDRQSFPVRELDRVRLKGLWLTIDIQPVVGKWPDSSLHMLLLTWSFY